MSVILGLNAYHGDSAACVLVDGQLVAAAEEERFRRLKHWAGFPAEAIRFCLGEAGAGLADVDHVALNKDPRANLRRKVAFVLRSRPSPRLVLERLGSARAVMSIEDRFSEAFPGQRLDARFHRVEHHLAHLASAFLVCPYEEAVVLSVDGFGDFASTAWGVGRGTELAIEGRVFYPHSLGIFYGALTQFLGFPHYGDEYKVMGLAPYGKPAYADQLRRLVRLLDDASFELDLDYFRFHREAGLYQWDNEVPAMDTLYSDAFVELLGAPRTPDEPLEQRHKDLAHSAQAVYEEAFFHLLDALHRRYGLTTLALAGGCGQNSVANGKIHLRSAFAQSYVPPSPPDAGGAIGAAASVWHSVAGGAGRRTIDDTPFTGPAYDTAHVEAMLGRFADELEGTRVDRAETDDALGALVAERIAAGEVVGWFQGRMEWGPRALGNRSIVCDPRRADMKDILNRKIKRRESFRPFAPSVLREATGQWFESDDDVPFMSKVFQIREEKRAQIPAVTHVDGSGRLQTVDARRNPRYHRLIRAFAERTGVPMILNTSFNENEPIVCTPEQALDCFLRTDMDVLVLNEIVVSRA